MLPYLQLLNIMVLSFNRIINGSVVRNVIDDRRVTLYQIMRKKFYAHFGLLI